MSGVEKVFAAPNAVHALTQVELEIAEGEFAAVVGPSGCGKSTLLDLIAGFELPTSGQIRIGESPVAGPGPDRAVVFQESALFPWLSVWENVVFSLKIRGGVTPERESLAGDTLEWVGLSAFRNHLPDQLSGGMKQRVGIARALLMQPDVFLMDEPFGSLDAQTRLQMQELLLGVWERFQKTVLFITHDIDEAILLADVVYIMSPRPGTIQARIPIRLPRPRDVELLTDASFNELRRDILHQIRRQKTGVS
jgi:NitT/TauT family transport system ATP-binding protein